MHLNLIEVLVCAYMHQNFRQRFLFSMIYWNVLYYDMKVTTSISGKSFAASLLLFWYLHMQVTIKWISSLTYYWSSTLKRLHGRQCLDSFVEVLETACHYAYSCHLRKLFVLMVSFQNLPGPNEHNSHLHLELFHSIADFDVQKFFGVCVP